MEIYDRLESVRSVLKLSQQEFAVKLEISQSVYARYENGSRKIPDDIKIKLYQIGVSLDWFITGQGSMFRIPQNIGTRLKESRLECNQDPNTVAVLLGISIEEYLQYEKNEIEPPVIILEKLEKIFNMSSTYIRSGHGNMFTNITGGAIINGSLVSNPETTPEYKRQYKIPHIIKTDDTFTAEMIPSEKSLMDEIYDLKKRLEKLEKK